MPRYRLLAAGAPRTTAALTVTVMTWLPGPIGPRDMDPRRRVPASACGGRGSSLIRTRQDHREARAAAGRRVRPDGPVVRVHDPPGDREAQARPPGAVARGPGDARERLEDALALRERDAGPAVVHVDP